MSLQNTSRGVEDLVYNLRSSLERFKGVNGLQRLVTTGKLSLLSLFGEFERTRDELYERRSGAVNATRRCLVQIAEEFDGITGTSQRLVQKLDHLFGTLENFHRTCDMELDDRSTAVDADAQQLLRNMAEMRETNNQFKTSLHDFCSATSTCADLTRSAVMQLEEVDMSTSCDVSASLTDFDRQRRRVQLKENEVTNAMSRASSRQDPAVQFAEFNYLKESEALEGYGKRYMNSLAAAMTATKFALEQSSMTGWASSNIFFVQLGLFLHEMAAGSKAVAANLLAVKNAQKVSRQLTAEKYHLLRQQHAAVGGNRSPAGDEFLGSAASGVPLTAAAAPRSSPESASSAPVQTFAASPPTPSHQDPSLLPTPPAASRSVDLDDLFQ